MGAGAKRARHKLWLAILLLVAGAAAMPVVQWVVLKMLPFDNKSEFQLVLDMPEGRPWSRPSAPCWRWVGSSPGCPR